MRSTYCSTSKTRYTDTKFDIDESSFFFANGIDISKDSSIYVSKYDYHLLQKDYVNMNMSCRNLIEPLYENSDSVNNVEKLCTALLILVIINTAFLIAYNITRSCLDKLSRI